MRLADDLFQGHMVTLHRNSQQDLTSELDALLSCPLFGLVLLLHWWLVSQGLQ